MTARPATVPAGYDRHVRVIEEQRTFAPFGLRLWDWATDTPVADGLTVAVRPLSGGVDTQAFVTRSGIFAVRGVPGLWDVEHPDPDEDLTAGPTTRFVVRVRDTRGNFVPTGFEVDLPHSGVYPSPGALAPINGESTQFPGFPLFSAPTRPVPPGFAAIRADLRIDTGAVDHREQPVLVACAHAVVRVDVGGDSWFGVADSSGAALVMFPFPDFAKPSGSPTPGSAGIAPTDQGFAVSVSVRYGALTADPWIGAPDFDEVRAQTSHKIKPSATDPAVDALDLTITYPKELVLSTEDRSVLLIEAA